MEHIMKKVKFLISLVLVLAMLVTCASVTAFAEERITYGDVNNDGKINMWDVSVLMKHIAHWELEERIFNPEAADVTHDDKLNLQDVSKLLKYVTKWYYVVNPDHPC